MSSAQLDATLSVLRSLVRALPDRMRYEFSPHSLALLNALNAAEAKIAEVGR